MFVIVGSEMTMADLLQVLSDSACEGRARALFATSMLIYNLASMVAHNVQSHLPALGRRRPVRDLSPLSPSCRSARNSMPHTSRLRSGAWNARRWCGP